MMPARPIENYPSNILKEDLTIFTNFGQPSFSYYCTFPLIENLMLPCQV
jgi:hypothetical protein